MDVCMNSFNYQCAFSSEKKKKELTFELRDTCFLILTVLKFRSSTCPFPETVEEASP